MDRAHARLAPGWREPLERGAIVRAEAQGDAYHPALRPPTFLTGSEVMFIDATGDVATQASLATTTNTFIAWRIGGGTFDDSARAILVEYNAGSAPVTAKLPGLYPGMAWWSACDTSSGAASNSSPPGQETEVTTSTYTIDARSVVVLIEHI
jgi:isoamylase